MSVAGQEHGVTSAATRRIADIDLTPSLARDTIVARWGPSIGTGPARAIDLYYLGTGEKLWLTFSPAPDEKLVRALVFSASPVAQPRAVFDNDTLAKARRCDQFDFTKPLDAATVHLLWSNPDSVIGSGVDHWNYLLADGTMATLIFAGDRVIGFTGCNGRFSVR